MFVKKTIFFFRSNALLGYGESVVYREGQVFRTVGEARKSNRTLAERSLSDARARPSSRYASARSSGLSIISTGHQPPA